MKPSFPDIFTGWKINQVLPPNETITAFSQSPGACSWVVCYAWAPQLAWLSSRGRNIQPGCDLTGFAQEYTPSEDSLIASSGASYCQKALAFFNT